MQKDFDRWNRNKRRIHEIGARPFYHAREIWWCAVGGNATNFGTSTAYTWTYRNMMSAAGIAAATSTYGYDHNNQRVRQSTTATTTHYINKYYSVTGASSTAYIYQGDVLVATVETIGSNSTTYFMHPDHLGSTNVVTNASGTVVQTLDYYPYGSRRIAPNEIATIA